MKVHQVSVLLNDWAPLAYAEDFDNVGLLVGNTHQKVSNILVSHDALENVVDEAIRKDCNLIVCFHPIIFSGLKRLVGQNYVQRSVQKAIKNDIAIYAVHTGLDNMSKGVNFAMCNALDIDFPKILIPKKNHILKLTTYIPHTHTEQLLSALFDAGAGSIGNYDECSFTTKGNGTYRGNELSNPVLGEKGKRHTEPETQISISFEKHLQSKILNTLIATHPYEEVAYEVTTLQNALQTVGMGMIGDLKDKMSEKAFLAFAKAKFKTGNIRHSQLTGNSIQKVAVLGGSGAFAIEAAISQGADALITADLKYHDFYKAENKIILLDVGHYESERFTKNLIAGYLTEKISTFAIILSEENTNPINYF
ncbi:Nif3-like dinuclear metal center hexameric protein [Dokdonia sp. Hel_I_53]|uniref:Nif3-like dinuclear metal center hexameric protein n=1 Tax=Dokdonia sp. Hel_I_53 TaxID=1566287 RepID=UPI00119AB213|nr:Nif3-like dinuclear metal center hexameric protein [Dokdonia sp. Hel_I_53]TVZ52099.1 dinuclear metal center YbgI/SA1388 family protein [Dokdonia sp. Hel_I_53]